MSKQRAQRRQARLAESHRRSQQARLDTGRTVARRRRRTALRRQWRRVRLWQAGPGAGRNRERWAALIIGLLILVLCTYLFSSSLTAVAVVVLVIVIALPALIGVVSDRSSR